MKKILLPFLGLILILTACNNDFSVNDKWKDVTIVYGLLNPTSDTNWIRVQRGYLGTSPASLSFSNPDSLYYDSIDVILESYNIASNSQTLDRVDSFALVRDDHSRQLDTNGPFTTDGYRIYRTTRKIDEDLRYKLTVKKHKAKQRDAYASTDIVTGYHGQGIASGFRIRVPNPVAPIPEFQGTISWYTPQYSKATFYQCYLYFTYKEFDKTTKQSELKTIKMDYGDLNATGADYLILDPPLNNLYQFIAGKVKIDSNKLRFFDHIKIVVWGGAENLQKYISINEPSTGINQNKPVFPDIENGTGLFSSRTSITMDSIKLTQTVVDKYYLTKILCSRQFAVAEQQDTFTCADYGAGPEKVPVE